MFLRHEMGHFMLESVQSREREGCVLHGILITVQSLEEDYSIMGMIVDAVEDLLSDHYPGITTLTQESQTRSYLDSYREDLIHTPINCNCNLVDININLGQIY